MFISRFLPTRSGAVVLIATLISFQILSIFYNLQNIDILLIEENVHILETNGQTDQINNTLSQGEEETIIGVDYDNVCLSPEKEALWVFNGTCEEQPYHSKFSSTGQSRSCGFCGDNTAYLRELRDEVAAKYEKKCKDLVVYGAALGEKYEDWLRSTDFLTDHTSKVVRRHGTCFIQFVTDVKDTKDLMSVDGSQNLVVIDPAKMPYENNRRNTKVLKFNPGLIFPWADRVIWQDVKLQHYSGLPSDYLLHFDRTIQRFGTCSSFVGLPHHEYSIGRSNVVNLIAQCNAVIKASKHRPTVSDNIDVLISQCKRSEEWLKKLLAQDTRSEIFDDAPLVDTAFIVYDMRTPACRQFNGNLGCSLLDEIHCYSDRDQISFPMVVANSGLRLSPTLHITGYEFRDRVYINENKAPMLHVAKRSCHWYYRSFSRCIASEQEVISAGSNSDKKSIDYLPAPPGDQKKYRIAVIVSGTLQRFIFTSTLEHLIKPMTKFGIQVDYYVSLTTSKHKAYRSNSGYTDHLQPDPTLPTSDLHDNIDIEEYVRKNFPGTIGAFQIQESIDIDSEPMLKARRKTAIMDNPNEDPDQRFPVFDNRNVEIAQRTANANRNLLKMHLAIQNLWTRALKWEAEEGFEYDGVIFLRDDSFWLDNLNINIVKLAMKEGDVFVPSCDARDPPLDPNEMNDHILISRRNSADLFGNYYSTLFQTDVKGCMDRLPETLIAGGKRGCNSEMLLKWVVDMEGLNVTKVSQSEVPFQRTANVKLSDGSNMQCFHKFCQSKDLPLQFTDENKDIEICNNIDWDAIFTPF